MAANRVINSFEINDMKIGELGYKDVLRVLGWYFAWSLIFWLFGYYALVEIVAGNGLHLFRLGDLPVSSMIYSSKIEVMVFCVFACIVLAIGFYLRYVSYGEEMQFKRQVNIKKDHKLSDALSDMDDGN
jgi:hypothetical protein